VANRGAVVTIQEASRSPLHDAAPDIRIEIQGSQVNSFGSKRANNIGGEDTYIFLQLRAANFRPCPATIKNWQLTLVVPSANGALDRALDDVFGTPSITATRIVWIPLIPLSNYYVAGIHPVPHGKESVLRPRYTPVRQLNDDQVVIRHGIAEIGWIGGVLESRRSVSGGPSWRNHTCRWN